MEKDLGSLFQRQHSGQQSPISNALGTRFILGQRDTPPACTSSRANLVPPNDGTLLGFPSFGFPLSRTSQSIEPRDCFYRLPSLHRDVAPVTNSILKEESPAGLSGKPSDVVPSPASGQAQKRFLVFDQSGDQTTLIFSSWIGTAGQCLPPWGSKLNDAYDLNKREVEKGRDSTNFPGPILTEEDNENLGDSVGSEMHEDTEELDALLYSDDDDNYSEDDEEASTGHSPSTMTAHEKQEWFEESVEEVASSAGPNKRMKLFDGGYDVPSVTDTASSVKPERCFDYEDDAQSSCADGKNQGFEEFGSVTSNKRLRKDKIRETVNVLQNIVPGGKGKDAIVILDEAISYLRSLKHKAQALGVDML